jgi:MoaA/NifB/PqqE/SkfB family radical SAM enzyme
MTKPYHTLSHANKNSDEWFVVNWCLGNSCTYECTYCPDQLHDGSVPWPDIAMITGFIDKIKSHYKNKKIYFEFTGGEVTVYRDFIDICKYCYEHDIKVGLISNGSRTIRWWEENKKYFDHVCLSFHPEFASPDHFLSVVKTLHTSLKTHVNVMMHPDKFDLCVEVANRVVEIGNASLALQPLIIDFGHIIYDYTEDQHRIINNQHEFTNRIKYNNSFEYYRGAMRMHHYDNTTTVQAPHKFIAYSTNNWQGWECDIGLEQLIVDMDGNIARGWCKIGGHIGHISDKEISFPVSPIICTKTMCHCNFDIMSTKRAVASPIRIIGNE